MWLLIIGGIVSIAACDCDHLESIVTASSSIQPQQQQRSQSQHRRADVENVNRTDVVEYDLNIDPITHLEMIKQTIELDKRVRRNPQYTAFDRGYDEFLRNYRQDNGLRRDNVKVKESDDQSESDETEETDDDDGGGDDDDDDDDDASDERPRKGKNKEDDYRRIKQESSKPRKSNYCKTERRGEMLCTICHNPKTDDQSESCGYSSEPKGKKISYANEKKKSHRESDDDRESFEEGREYTTKRPNPFNAQRPLINRYPVQRNIPQGTYRKILAPNTPYSIIRYRTVTVPRPQRIRIITLPGPVPSLPHLNNPLAPIPLRPRPPAGTDIRPQRDTGWLQNRPPPSLQLTAPKLNIPTKKPKESEISSESAPNSSESIEETIEDTKSNEIEIIPEYFDKNNDGEFAELLDRDWSSCRNFTEGELFCYECDQANGSKNKECQFTTKKKPDESRQAYAKSKAFHYEQNTHEPLRSPSNHRRAKIHPAWQSAAAVQGTPLKRTKLLPAPEIVSPKRTRLHPAWRVNATSDTPNEVKNHQIENVVARPANITLNPLQSLTLKKIQIPLSRLAKVTVDTGAKGKYYSPYGLKTNPKTKAIPQATANGDTQSN